MGNHISFYPILEPLLIQKMNYQSQISLFYFDEKDKKIEIDYNKKNRYIFLETKNIDFNPVVHDLYINVSIKLENANLLYGPNTGIAPNNSKLNVFFEYYSQKSKKRYVVKCNKKIESINSVQEFVFRTKIDKNTIINDLDMNITIFLEEKSMNVNQDEKYLNNREGVLLGNFETLTMYLEGSKSLFPICFQDMDNSLLWDVIIDYENPASDKFSDSVKLIINKKHKDFQYVDSNGEHFNESFINEIIATTMVIVVDELKKEGCIDDIHKDSEEGSILHLLKYYNDVLNFDLKSNKELSKSIRELLNKGI